MTDTERADLDARALWMRDRGVMSARFPDGLQLVLGPEPAPPPASLRAVAQPLTDDEVATREARKQERERAVALAATGRVV